MEVWTTSVAQSSQKLWLNKEVCTALSSYGMVQNFEVKRAVENSLKKEQNAFQKNLNIWPEAKNADQKISFFNKSAFSS